MPASDDVRRKIAIVEVAMKEAGTPEVLNAIIDTLKAISTALDNVEMRAGTE